MNRPKKPATLAEQIDTLWDYVFNDLTHKLSRQDLKINLILSFGALSLALLGIIIALTR